MEKTAAAQSATQQTCAAASTGSLFGIGALATVLVTISAALPMHGAILDGRHRTEREAADVLDLTTTQTGRRPTA